jgi:tripeptidyl-peptidase I
MGVRGISVLVASGDNGVGCNKKCTSQEFDFPSSPYITLVGSTEFTTATSETGAKFSSGGFSRDQWRPSYQAAAVNSYLTSGVKLPDSSYYFANGRAYPDISAVGVDIGIVVNGKPENVDGTSCSAPIVAGIIAILNGQRLSKGKAPLGFLNPLLYQNPSAFYDVTSGSNPYLCCPVCAMAITTLVRVKQCALSLSLSLSL